MANDLRGTARRLMRFRDSLSATLVLSVLSLACGESTAPTSLRQARATISAEASPDAGHSEAIPGQYIITFADSVNDPSGLAKKIATENGSSPIYTYTTAIKGFAAKLPARAIEGLLHNPHIERIEQDATMHAEASGTQLSPLVWGLDRIDQTGRPLDGKFSYSADGSGVNAYIIDSGIRTTHVEFGGRAFAAYTAIADGNGANDCNGHGTGVAGSLGSKTYGVAKNVRLFAVRVADCNGTGSYSALIAGIDWVTQNRVFPAVANVSLVGSYSSSVNAAVQNSIASGVVYVVAAGNSVADACKYSPASTPSALTAAAIEPDMMNPVDVQASYSNYGACVDLFAPGSGIRSTYNLSDTATTVWSGTSIASPYVAGVAALYLSAYPAATPSQVAAAIVGGATPNAISGVTAGTPNRLLNSNILGSAPAPAPPTNPDTTSAPTPPPPSPSSPPVVSFSANGCPKATCTFDGTSSTAASGIASYSWTFGDGAIATSGVSLAKVSHWYAVKGAYVVRLTVTDKLGRTSSASQTISIKKP